jgi:zinc-RING finger domain
MNLAVNTVADDCNWRECPNCYEAYVYSSNKDQQHLLPRLLGCGHLVCSSCATELWQDAQVCCPTCMETSACESAEHLPIPQSTPLTSPSGSPMHSPQARRPQSGGFSGGDSDGSRPSSLSAGTQSRLLDFLTSSPKSAAPQGEEGDRLDAEQQEEPESKHHLCLVDQCSRERLEGRYFCEAHKDRIKRITWTTAATMSKRYTGVSDYTISTITGGDQVRWQLL